jgi:hypothetical protein
MSEFRTRHFFVRWVAEMLVLAGLLVWIFGGIAVFYFANSPVIAKQPSDEGVPYILAAAVSVFATGLVPVFFGQLLQCVLQIEVNTRKEGE